MSELTSRERLIGYKLHKLYGGFGRRARRPKSNKPPGAGRDNLIYAAMKPTEGEFALLFRYGLCHDSVVVEQRNGHGGDWDAAWVDEPARENAALLQGHVLHQHSRGRFGWWLRRPQWL